MTRVGRRGHDGRSDDCGPVEDEVPETSLEVRSYKKEVYRETSDLRKSRSELIKERGR